MDEYVLIGSDDYGFAMAMMAEVESLGLEGSWAADGVDLLAEVEKAAPVAVFVDASIGGVSAAACCGQLRGDPTVPRALPIFLVSDEEVSAVSLEKAGFTGLWPKTHDASALRELLGNLRTRR